MLDLLGFLKTLQRIVTGFDVFFVGKCRQVLEPSGHKTGKFSIADKFSNPKREMRLIGARFFFSTCRQVSTTDFPRRPCAGGVHRTSRSRLAGGQRGVCACHTSPALSALTFRPLDPCNPMNDDIKKEVTELHRKLKEALATSPQPIPIAKIAAMMQKSASEAEWYVNAIREVVRRSLIVVITDQTGQKCAGIKVSTKKVSFRKPQ